MQVEGGSASLQSRENVVLHEQNGVAMLIELIMAILLSTTSEEDTAVAKASAEGGAIMTNWASGNMSVRHKLAASAVITLLNLSVDARTVQQVGDEEICRGGLRVLFIFCQIPAKER